MRWFIKRYKNDNQSVLQTLCLNNEEKKMLVKYALISYKD